MRAYNGTITLELCDAERTTLGKFYDLVSHGVLSNMTTADIYLLLESIAGKESILKYSKDFNGSLDDTEVMKLSGLSRNTYYKYKKELRSE